MLAILLVALGSTLAATGFMFIGIGLAVIGDNDLLKQLGWILLIGGLIATVVGIVMYRIAEAKQPASMHR
jgi:uncharacterized membrane protein